MSHTAQMVNCAQTTQLLATTALQSAQRSAAGSPPKRRAARAAPLAAVAAVLVVMIAGVSGGVITDTPPYRQYTENFNSLPTGSTPTDTWYNIMVAGSGTNQVVTAPAGMTGKAWEVKDNGVPYTARFYNTGAGVNLCSVSQSVSYDLHVPDLTLNDVREVRATLGAVAVSTTAAPANTFGLRLTGTVLGTNTANFYVRGDAQGAPTLSASGVQTPGTIVHVQMSQVNCSPNLCVVFTFTGLTGLTSPLTQCSSVVDALVGTVNALSIADTASIAQATVHLDNYDWQGAPIPNTDTDGDGVPDTSDNCINTVNPSQLDQDGDNVGNACDTDLDGDGLLNTAEPDYAGTPDRDADGYTDGPNTPANNPAVGQPGHLERADNCPDTPNPTQTDTDGDGIGDACASAGGGADPVDPHVITAFGASSQSDLYISPDGDLLVVAHILDTGNALVVTYSNDGGETWVDKTTGISNAQNPKVVAIDAFRIAIKYTTLAFPAGQQLITKTTNAGNTWTTAFSNMNYEGGCGLSGNALMDMTIEDDSIYFTTAILEIGVDYQTRLAVRKTDDFFTTAPTIVNQYVEPSLGCASLEDTRGMAIIPGTAGECAYFAIDATGAGGNTAIRAELCAGTGAINDPIAPLSNYGHQLNSDKVRGKTLTFTQGASPTHYVAHQTPQATWQFVQLGTSTTLNADFLRPINGGLTRDIPVSTASTDFYFGRLSADVDSITYTYTGVVPGTNSVTHVNPGIATDCIRLWYSYRDQTTNQLGIAAEPYECAVPLIGIKAFTTVTDLTGFEVDPTNSVVIARVDNGVTIKTFNPSDLSEIASQALDAGCGAGHWDGVGALAAGNNLYTTYYNCFSDGSTDRLAIRSNTLGPPIQPQICVDGSFCDIDLDDNSALTNGACNSLSLDDQEIPPDLTRLGKVSMALWDWSTNSEEGLDHATLGWIYTGADSGNVGIFGITQNNNEDDCAGVVERQATTDTELASGACFAHNTENGKMAVATTDNSGPARSFNADLDVTFTGGPGVFAWYPDVTLNTATVSGATYNDLIALSCTEEQWAVVKNGVEQIDPNGIVGVTMDENGVVRHSRVYPTEDFIAWGPPTWSLQGYATPFGHHNAVAISGDGHWAAYLFDASTVNIVNATSGEFRGQAALPAGDCCWEMKLDDTGQTLYVASQTYIVSYDVVEITTVIPVPPLTRPLYDGSGNGTYSDSVCVNTNGIQDAPDCPNASNPACTQTPGGCAATGGQQPTTPTGTQQDVTGSLPGCGVGGLFLGLTATQQMAVMTGLMLLLGFIGLYIIGKKREGVSGAVISVIAVIIYTLSLYLWCAPAWPLVVVAVLGVVFAFVKGRAAGG